MSCRSPAIALAVSALNLLAACTPTTPRPSPGADDVCWDIANTWTGTTDLCPDQKVCFPKTNTIQESDPNATGFVCTNDHPMCKVPPADQIGNGYETGYSYAGSDLAATLYFDSSIMLGYSLDNFRKYLSWGSVSWKADATYWLSVDGDHAAVEIVSYNAPMLRVRISGVVKQTMTTIITVPHTCATMIPGPLPTYCTQQTCTYASAGDADAVQLTADIEVPIEPLTP